MTNINFLIALILGFAIVAAICTTAFPILYAFFPWRSNVLGKILMLQGISFALAMDGTVIFNLFVPNTWVPAFYIEAVIFGMIAFSTASLTVLMWKANRTNRKLKKEEQHGRHQREDAGPVAQREGV